ncbi:hypothetical protein [Tenacibaculum litopenaei]
MNQNVENKSRRLTGILLLFFENFMYFYLKVAEIGEGTSNKRTPVVIQ